MQKIISDRVMSASLIRPGQWHLPTPVTSATIAEHVAHHLDQYAADDLMSPAGMIVDSDGRNVSPDWETVHSNKVWSVWITDHCSVFAHGCTVHGDDDEAEHSIGPDVLDGLKCVLDEGRWQEIYDRHPYTWDGLETKIELADATVFRASISPDADWQGPETGWIDLTTVHATLNGVPVDDESLNDLELLAGWQEVTR